MDVKVAKQIVEAAEENEIELSLYEGYSGRGMYGEETTGITGSFSSLLVAVAITAKYMADDEHEDFCSTLTNIRHDTLGRDLIFY